MKWYLDTLKQYAVFTGRARRKEFWMFFFISLLFQFVVAFAVGLITNNPELAGIAGNIYTIAVFLPMVGVSIRRMHDIGRSGWWILLPVVNIIFYCLDSQPHDNEYGPNPKAVLNEAQA